MDMVTRRGTKVITYPYNQPQPVVISLEFIFLEKPEYQEKYL